MHSFLKAVIWWDLSNRQAYKVLITKQVLSSQHGSWATGNKQNKRKNRTSFLTFVVITTSLGSRNCGFQILQIPVLAGTIHTFPLCPHQPWSMELPLPKITLRSGIWDKENMVDINNGVLFSYREEKYVTCKKMDRTEEHHIKWNKSDWKTSITCFLSHVDGRSEKWDLMKVERWPVGQKGLKGGKRGGIGEWNWSDYVKCMYKYATMKQTTMLYY